MILYRVILKNDNILKMTINYIVKKILFQLNVTILEGYIYYRWYLNIIIRALFVRIELNF